ncbi:MAG: UPF0104 family protein [Burkholderiales bacterium]|jgi:glycosyltransferase 2 family protein|nr:UPF0104 family protein [Burkholderiales bacterium]
MRLRQLSAWLRRTLTIGLLLAGVTLWTGHLHRVDWNGMRQAVGDMPHEMLMWAEVFTVASYLVYSSIDLLARCVTGHRIGVRRVFIIGFVSHACALNLGPAGAGFRFRLYMTHGLDTATSAATWLFNIATNWIGFVLIAGAAFTMRTMKLPLSWGMASDASQLIGVLLLGAVGGYLAACVMAHGRRWRVFDRELTLPSLGIALLQCLVSTLNWGLLAWVLTMLLQHRVDAASVLAALMTSALALAVIDVPAGLGVTETVFLAMLGAQVPANELLAALLAYRAIYYLAPLLVALAVYLALEFDASAYRARRAARHGKRIDVRG